LFLAKRSSIKKLIINGLYSKDLIESLYNNKSVLKKAYWFVMGNDLHRRDAIEKNDFNFKEQRKCFIQNLGGVISFMKPEIDIINKVYETKCKWVQGFWLPSNLAINNINVDLKQEISVIIGNSGNQDCKHVEILKDLVTHINNITYIYCPLGYGGVADYRKNVIKVGKELFGDKFIFSEAFDSPEEYAAKLAQSKRLIMLYKLNPKGFGSTVQALSLGVTLYMDKDSIIYQTMKNLGFIIFDYYESFRDFPLLTQEERQNNINLARATFSKEALINQMKSVLSF